MKLMIYLPIELNENYKRGVANQYEK